MGCGAARPIRRANPPRQPAAPVRAGPGCRRQGAVWADFGAPHERLVRGFVVDCRFDGDDDRIVTFPRGLGSRAAAQGCGGAWKADV